MRCLDCYLWIQIGDFCFIIILGPFAEVVARYAFDLSDRSCLGFFILFSSSRQETKYVQVFLSFHRYYSPLFHFCPFASPSSHSISCRMDIFKPGTGMRVGVCKCKEGQHIMASDELGSAMVEGQPAAFESRSMYEGHRLYEGFRSMRVGSIWGSVAYEGRRCI